MVNEITLSELQELWASKFLTFAEEYRTACHSVVPEFISGICSFYDTKVTSEEVKALIEDKRPVDGDSIFPSIRVWNIFTSLLQLLPLLEQDVKLIGTSRIRDIHRTLMSGLYSDQLFIQYGERPGDYVKHDKLCSANAKDISGQMKALVDSICEKDFDNPIEMSVYFALELIRINPFADGNCALAIILMNYYLLANDYPPIILNKDDGLLTHHIADYCKNPGSVKKYLPYFDACLINTSKFWNIKKSETG